MLASQNSAIARTEHNSSTIIFSDTISNINNALNDLKLSLSNDLAKCSGSVWLSDSVNPEFIGDIDTNFSDFFAKN